MKNRRNFLKTCLASSSSLALGSISFAAQAHQAAPAFNEPKPEPTEAQKRWMELGFGMFIHFGLNTFAGKEWGDGTENPSIFNPPKVDTDQWCKVASEAGMKYIVLVTKHHDGFCLWPSKTTKYSVTSSPYQKDIVRQLVDSARKHGLKPGFYYSIWDRNEPSHDKDEYAYVKFMKAQIHELLTEYGDVAELWLDGFWKKQQTGWKDGNGNFAQPEDFIQAWRMEGAYRWQIDHVYQYIKSLQPNCIVLNNATTEFPGVPLHPVDALSGEKATGLTSYRKVWPWLGKPKFFPMQIETTMSQEGIEQFKNGNWFWQKGDNTVATKEQILGWLENAQNIGANLLLNCGPMPNGELRPEDVEVLTSLRK